ncbi:hypothetical protein [Robinsoniella sp.]
MQMAGMNFQTRSKPSPHHL